jgi:hypothetical protein
MSLIAILIALAVVAQAVSLILLVRFVRHTTPPEKD